MSREGWGAQTESDFLRVMREIQTPVTPEPETPECAK
jgi:hypothetical protein